MIHDDHMKRIEKHTFSVFFKINQINFDTCWFTNLKDEIFAAPEYPEASKVWGSKLWPTNPKSCGHRYLFFFLTGWVEDVAAKGCWRWLWWSWFRRFRGSTFFILLVAFICVGPQTWHRTSCIQTARKQPALSSWASQPKVNSMQSNGLSTWRDSFRVMWSHKAFKRLLRGQQKSKRTWRIFLRR